MSVTITNGRSYSSSDIIQQATQINLSAAETTILTAVAGKKLNILNLVITNASDSLPVTVTIKDATSGTTRAIINLAVNGGISLPINGEWVQTTAGDNWTVTLSTASVVVDIFVIARKA